MASKTASSSSEPENNEELEQITIARALMKYRQKEKMATSNPDSPITFPTKFQIQNPRPTKAQPPPATTSKILPLICQNTPQQNRHVLTTMNGNPKSRHPLTAAANENSMAPPQLTKSENQCSRPLKFPAVEAAPYVPIRQMGSPCRGIAPPVSIRTAVPVFAAPPLPLPAAQYHQGMQFLPEQAAPINVNIRQVVPLYAAPSVRKDEPWVSQ